MNVFQELCFTPGPIWFSYVLMLQHRKACVFLEISSEATKSCSLCSYVHKHTQWTFPILKEAPKGKGQKRNTFQSGSSIDFFWLYWMQRQRLSVLWLTLGSLSSVSSQVMVARTSGYAHDPEGPISLLPLSVQSSPLLPGVSWDSWLLVWVPLLFRISYLAVGLAFWSLHRH